MRAVLVALFIALPTPVLAATPKPVLAVFDIEARFIKVAQAKLLFWSDLLATSLVTCGAYEVIPRSRLRATLQQYKKASYKLCYDQKCQIAIGRELAASKSVATQLVGMGEQCMIMSVIYDLAKSTAEHGATLQSGCSEAEVSQAMRKTANLLCRTNFADKSARSEAQPSAPKVTKPPPASRPARPAPARRGIDARAVTVGQYADCVNAQACEKREDPFSTSKPSDPAADVTWYQAKSFCEWRRQRLPYKHEWLSAARDPAFRLPKYSEWVADLMQGETAKRQTCTRDGTCNRFSGSAPSEASSILGFRCYSP